jgi:hypothetical protein
VWRDAPCRRDTNGPRHLTCARRSRRRVRARLVFACPSRLLVLAHQTRSPARAPNSFSGRASNSFSRAPILFSHAPILFSHVPFSFSRAPISCSSPQNPCTRGYGSGKGQPKPNPAENPYPSSGTGFARVRVRVEKFRPGGYPCSTLAPTSSRSPMDDNAGSYVWPSGPRTHRR